MTAQADLQAARDEVFALSARLAEAERLLRVGVTDVRGVWTPSAPDPSPQQMNEAMEVISTNPAVRDGLVRSFTGNGVDWYFTAFRKGSIFVNENGEPRFLRAAAGDDR
jgi:hypothetical protein